MHLAFGVTSQQRIKPLVEAVESLGIAEKKPAMGRMAAALGVMAALAAFLIRFARSQR